ncbi:hypothetical protein CgunFtcFv8_015941 [Champsocephalus gunnari]|uniref:Uncharacterized protein n=1 Tax=Champsocephalus gunnari TaxID=52237 RepID=A0AAN8C7V2_CHAGU|nr:hypothetical protein CgunFtcFv8_015941 [Champsocephalus gunnari]
MGVPAASLTFNTWKGFPPADALLSGRDFRRRLLLLHWLPPQVFSQTSGGEPADPSLPQRASFAPRFWSRIKGSAVFSILCVIATCSHLPASSRRRGVKATTPPRSFIPPQLPCEFDTHSIRSHRTISASGTL